MKTSAILYICKQKKSSCNCSYSYVIQFGYQPKKPIT